MKICFLLGSLNGGGAEKVFLNLANYYIDLGIVVEIVFVRNNLQYIDLVDKRINLIWLEKKRSSESILAFRRYLAKSKPSVVLSALPHVNLLAAIVGLLTANRIPVILTEHSSLTRPKGAGISFGDSVRSLLAKALYRKAQLIIAVSKGVENDLIRKYGLSNELVKTIYNPIVSEQNMRLSNIKLSDAWFQNKDRWHLISVGRLTEAKDYSTALRAIRVLLDRGEPVDYTIVGDGELRSKLEAELVALNLTSSVRMVGFQNNPYNFIKNADLLILSSKWEGFSNVLVESLMAGTPVVSTDCQSGPSEILEYGRWGTLVPLQSPGAIADAVIKTLNHKPSAAALQQRAEDFRVEKIGRQYLDVITDIVEKHNLSENRVG